MSALQTVKDFLALFHTRQLDVAAVRSLLANDARYQPIVPIVPMRQGADAICFELQRQYQLYDECACDILSIAVAGSTVFTERVDACRQLADGRQTTTHVVGVFDVDENGKITWWREYWDCLDCAGQLGIDDKAMRSIMCA